MVVEMFEHNGHGIGRLDNFVDQGSKIRSPVLKTFEYVAFIFNTRIIFHAFDNDMIICPIPGFC
jgi:hypothetical protein